jgi:virginiamycin B lyase
MAQHRGHGQPRRPKARRRAGAGTKRTTAAAAPTGTGMAGGVFLGQLYWANRGDGTIWRANLDGSNPQAIITGQNLPWGVAVDPSYLYWTNQGTNTIWRANLDGTNPQTFATGQDDPWGVAVSPVMGVG